MALQEEFEKQGNWLFRYRSFLPLIVLSIGTVLYIRTEIYPETFILEETPYEIYYEMLALTISLFGLLIRAYTVGHTPKSTSGRNTKEGQVADTLNTKGIYSAVRHPLYVGNFLMWFGPAMLTGNLWFIVSFCLFFWLYYERIMYAEEQFLRKRFGATYLEWSNRVPAFMPNFRNFEKSHLPFSWKKVIIKEINGLLALFLIFTTFDVIGQILENQSDYNYFLVGMSVLSGVTFIILKILKKKTTLLRRRD